jgi:hypothetical protein
VLPSRTFARYSIFFAYGFCTSPRSSANTVSSSTCALPSQHSRRLIPSVKSIVAKFRHNRFSVLIRAIDSDSDRAMFETFTSFAAWIP